MTDYSTQINLIIAQLPQWLKSIFFLKSARLKKIIFKIIDFRIRSKKKSHPTLLQAEEKRARNPVPKCPSKLLEPAIGRSAG